MSCLHHSIWNVNTEPDNTAWGCTQRSCEFKENHLWQPQKLQHPKTFILLEKCVSFHQIFWCARNHSKEVWKYPNSSWHISIPFNSFRLPQLSERMLYKRIFIFLMFPGDSVVKNPPAYARDVVSVPRSVRSSGEGNGNPLQYSCLGNPIDRGDWWATVPWGCKRVGHDLVNNNNICISYSFFFLFYTIQWIPWEATEISLFMLCLTEFCKRAGIWTQTSTGCSVTYMTQSWTTQQSLTATFTQIKAQESKDWFWANWQATPILFFGRVITSRPASELL